MHDPEMDAGEEKTNSYKNITENFADIWILTVY